jgi:hypothetical protein
VAIVNFSEAFVEIATVHCEPCDNNVTMLTSRGLHLSGTALVLPCSPLGLLVGIVLVFAGRWGLGLHLLLSRTPLGHQVGSDGLHLWGQPSPECHTRPNACPSACPYTHPGVEIRGRPFVPDHHFLGKDNHVLTDGSPSDNLIFALIIVLYEEGPLSLGWDNQIFQRW